MSRFIRSSLTAILILVSSAFLAQTIAGRGQAPPSPVSAADAAPFAGDWSVNLSTESFQNVFLLSVKTDGGKVSATISAQAQPTVNVTDISMSGKSLVLKYMTSMQGTTLSNVLMLTPQGADLTARLVLMDGQYEMNGAAGRQAPGAPLRAAASAAGGRGAPTNEKTDFTPKPPYKPRTPAEEAAGFMLPAGYRMELVAADPEIDQPDDHRVRRQRPHVRRRDDQLHDGRRAPRASTIRSAASAAGRAPRATATTTSTPSSPTTSSRRA